tara:strand:+ start:4937 stop:5854 length:918 start_codon:yes stop_codon:yes gene_type:complete
MSIPWVEKYRPQHFDDLILSTLNRKILSNIIETGFIPNLLFYGPPGTGKTTTIINLMNSYQKKYNQQGKGLVIHLNASDERGIDIIRNQINKFVNSKTLFSKGIKFVVLDEVDYMTKNAQQALCYLLQKQKDTVRFCLICNYISKIEESLQNEFMKLRFNQLPSKNIVTFLHSIVEKENVDVNVKCLKNVQIMFKSDIRSMINYIQLNQTSLNKEKIIDEKKWQDIFSFLTTKTLPESREYLSDMSSIYDIEKKNIIKNLINYIIHNKDYKINKSFLNMIEFIVHDIDVSSDYYINYSLLALREL